MFMIANAKVPHEKKTDPRLPGKHTILKSFAGKKIPQLGKNILK